MRSTRSLYRCVPLATAVMLASGCVAHPVGPARTERSYRAKARTTAGSATSAVESARLAAGAGARGRTFEPYLSVTIGEAEEAIAGLSGTFASIQPPSGNADPLRDELLGLLSDAEDHLAALRIAIRRSEGRAALARLNRPLAHDADRLRAFEESTK